MTTLLSSLKSWFRPRAVKLTGARLYARCVTQARLPVFYLDYGIEDAIGARFELLTLHVILVVTALKALPADDPRREQVLDTSQNLFDAFLLALDSALREQGTGDLTVPKKMKRLGVVVYSRMKAWDDMWREGAGVTLQAEYATRTLYAASAYDHGDETSEGDAEPAPAAVSDGAMSRALMSRALALAAYIETARDALDIDDLLQGRIAWPEPDAVAATETRSDDAPLATPTDSADSMAIEA